MRTPGNGADVGASARAVSAGARRRAREGTERAHSSAWAVAQAAVGVALAYAAAQWLLGHEYPFFAGVAAFVCLGLGADRRLRRVGELAVGVSLGVLFGEVFVEVFGGGPVQIAVVLGLAVMTARLLDGGQLVATQAGVQAVLVVGLPPSAGGPFLRWQDAAVGSLVALVLAAAVPEDPRRLLRRRLRALLGEVSDVLRMLAAAVAADDPLGVERALERARASQPDADALAAAVRGAREVVRIAPLWWRCRPEVDRLATSAGGADLAARNLRVVARRIARSVSSTSVQDLTGVPALLTDLADGVDLLAGSTSDPVASARAREAVVAVAERLGQVEGEAPHAAAVREVCRPLVVDLLQSCGLDGATARATLPASR